MQDSQSPYLPPRPDEPEPIPEVQDGPYEFEVPVWLVFVNGLFLAVAAGFYLVQDGFLLAACVTNLRECVTNEILTQSAVSILWLLMHLVIFSGAIAMIRLQDYQSAWYASVLSCFFCLGPAMLPMGIIGVVALRQPSAKTFFRPVEKEAAEKEAVDTE